jgi:Arc/MetJ family transcription regulator
MRTTLDLDDELMSALLARHPGATKARAVEHAIEDYLRRDAVRKLEDLVGRIEIEDVSKELRRMDRTGRR